MPVRPDRPIIPPVLYLPTDGTTTPSGDAQIALRRTSDGRTALLAYTALDRLIDCCGDEQPWVLLPTDRLDQVKATQAYDVLYLDLAIPPEHRYAEGRRP